MFKILLVQVAQPTCSRRWSCELQNEQSRKLRIYRTDNQRGRQQIQTENGGCKDGIRRCLSADTADTADTFLNFLFLYRF